MVSTSLTTGEATTDLPPIEREAGAGAGFDFGADFPKEGRVGTFGRAAFVVVSMDGAVRFGCKGDVVRGAWEPVTKVLRSERERPRPGMKADMVKSDEKTAKMKWRKGKGKKQW